MRRTTIYSIANELNISSSTVSRAFSRPDLVNAVLLEIILTKAQEMDYRPNRAARGLVTGRTGMIGLLVSDITNPFFPPLIRAIQNAAGTHDYNILLVDCGGDPDTEVDLVGRLNNQVDGFILASPRSEEDALSRVIGNTPTIAISREFDAIRSVIIDNSVALREAGAHLESLGHKTMALMAGPAKSWAAVNRADAVREWVQGSSVNLIELGNFDASYDGGREAAKELVKSGATAVFAFDDLMACGVIAELADAGVSVPGDCSLVGCDDVLLAKTITPRLTTVSAPVERAGEATMGMLLALIEGKPTANGSIEHRRVITGELVIRESTAKLN